jgi:hypothetical protein
VKPFRRRGAALLGATLLVAVGCGSSGASSDASGAAGAGGNAGSGGVSGSAGTTGAAGVTGTGGAAGANAGSGGTGVAGATGSGGRGGATGTGGRGGTTGAAGAGAAGTGGSTGSAGAGGGASCTDAPPVPCPQGQVCDYDSPGRCGAGFVQGHCIVLPTICTAISDPVCGCDNQTYGNDCERQRARVQLSHTGICDR